MRKGDNDNEKQNFNCNFCHHAVYTVDDFTFAQLRLGIGVADSGDYDLQLRRIDDLFRHFFYAGLYQRQGEIKTYSGMCCHQQHLRGWRDCDSLHDICMTIPGFVNG